MGEGIIIAIIATFGSLNILSLFVPFISAKVAVRKENTKNKNKKMFLMKGAFAEIRDAKKYLENSLELIAFIREQKDIDIEEKIKSADIRKQIDSISHSSIQHLYDNIFLEPEDFNYANKIYPVKEIKSHLQMLADLAIENKKSEEYFFEVIKESDNKIKVIENFASGFLKDHKIHF